MSVGPWQIVLILVIILVLFGAGKLPSVMKDLAKGVQAFKKGLREEEEETEKSSSKKETPLALDAEETASETKSSSESKEKKTSTPKDS